MSEARTLRTAVRALPWLPVGDWVAPTDAVHSAFGRRALRCAHPRREPETIPGERSVARETRLVCRGARRGRRPSSVLVALVPESIHLSRGRIRRLCCPPKRVARSNDCRRP